MIVPRLRNALARHRNLPGRMSRCLLVLLAVIVLFSVFGLQAWELFPAHVMTPILYVCIAIFLLSATVFFLRRGLQNQAPRGNLIRSAVLLLLLGAYALALEFPAERVHVALFFLLGVTASRDFSDWRHGVLVIFLVSYLDEALQFLIPWRVFGWEDVFLNVASSFIGLYLHQLMVEPSHYIKNLSS